MFYYNIMQLWVAIGLFTVFVILFFSNVLVNDYVWFSSHLADQLINGYLHPGLGNVYRFTYCTRIATTLVNMRTWTIFLWLETAEDGLNIAESSVIYFILWNRSVDIVKIYLYTICTNYRVLRLLIVRFLFYVIC